MPRRSSIRCHLALGISIAANKPLRNAAVYSLETVRGRVPSVPAMIINHVKDFVPSYTQYGKRW